MEIISRQEAKKASISTYYNGNPCKHGHIAKRRTSNGECEECGRIRANKTAKKLDKKTKAYRDKSYYERNKEKIRSIQNESYSNLTKEEKQKRRGIATELSKSKQKERSKRHYAENKDKHKELSKLWKSKNIHIIYANNQKRRSLKKQAIPKWSDLDAIKQIYADSILISNMTGIKHHVDHIVPLNSTIVCGLHCESNLRIITASENLEKGNLFWPDMP